jgi:hypothetical protein
MIPSIYSWTRRVKGTCLTSVNKRENQQNFIFVSTCTATPRSYLYLPTPFWRCVTPTHTLRVPCHSTHSHQHLFLNNS